LEVQIWNITARGWQEKQLSWRRDGGRLGAHCRLLPGRLAKSTRPVARRFFVSSQCGHVVYRNEKSVLPAWFNPG
jgi:hypothetical protein